MRFNSPSVSSSAHCAASLASAVEEYDGFGQLRKFLPGGQQFHELWLTGDYNGDPISVEFGIGAGLTSVSDGFTAKLMFMSDLTGPHGLLTERR